MVNFAELKAKAEKAKDASVTKVANTRDRFSSVPSSQVTWDPNWKRPPPAPRGSASASAGVPPPPVVLRASQPTDVDDSSALPSFTPRPPPARPASGYPPSHQRETSVERIDWAHLSTKDKEAFFGWLDEFFSRYLGIEVGPKAQRAMPAVQRAQHVMSRPPPTINMATRPQM